jgi:hypothetical protein
MLPRSVAIVMGFGSYDESEQERQEIDTTEIDTQDDTRTEFEGEFAFQSGANNEDLLAQLSEIKDEREQDGEQE